MADPGQAVVIEFVQGIFLAVVVGATKQVGVCHHDGRIVTMPEGPVVEPVNAWVLFFIDSTT
jgi:hypothetical protein